MPGTQNVVAIRTNETAAKNLFFLHMENGHFPGKLKLLGKSVWKTLLFVLC
jgi:hypothetical protein